jgi:Skp family chaperone for outer membrane proteins
MENEIQSKTVDYQNGWKQRQLQIDEQELEVNKQAFLDIQSVIETLAEQEAYHLVMRAQKDPRSQVLYFSAAIDITSQVVERLNKLRK